MARYHLKRRTAPMVDKMERYVRFYEMEMIVNRKRISDLSSIPLDQPITFRLRDEDFQQGDQLIYRNKRHDKIF